MTLESSKRRPTGGTTLIAACGLAATVAVAAPDGPAAGSPADIPLADYLALLHRISPAAHQGATTYLQAVQRRCGRALGSAELRRAVAEGDGEPVLMAMIRASHRQDHQALSQLSGQVACAGRGAR